MATSASSEADRVDVVVCVHNAIEDVRECLASLVRADGRHGRIILVDDGSDAPTADLLREFAAARSDVVLIRQQVAKGYTVAANAGIAASSADYVVLLNSDTIVTPGWLDRMLVCAERRPDGGIFGPLSNAASWQSIPQLRSEDGKWQVNDLPQGVAVDDFAKAIFGKPDPLYPRTWLVNGFCFMITRKLLNAIGLLDAETFPIGYGEEDDFALRARRAGFWSYVVDDCYVYHAKSKSFTAARRSGIVTHAKEKLTRKHGKDRVAIAVNETRSSEELLKARVHSYLAAERAISTREPPASFRRAALRIGWVQPHLGVVGGVRRAIEMTNRLADWGAKAALISSTGERPTWMPLTCDVLSFAHAMEHHFDVIIYSDPDVIMQALALNAELYVSYHLAAYMLYRKPSEGLAAYYVPRTKTIHLANSRWTAEQIKTHAPELDVRRIVGGAIDKTVFRPVPAEQKYDVGYLARWDRKHKDVATIMHATLGLRRSAIGELHPAQCELARLIAECRVFVSASWHEGFSFPPLEAMACGVPVVMTDDGGSRDYAQDGVNALVVPPREPKAMRAAIDRLLIKPELRLHVIENGLKTAWRHDWDDVTARFAQFIAEAFTGATRVRVLPSTQGRTEVELRCECGAVLRICDPNETLVCPYCVASYTLSGEVPDFGRSETPAELG